jgi:hypothetical protein
MAPRQGKAAEARRGHRVHAEVPARCSGRGRAVRRAQLRFARPPKGVFGTRQTLRITSAGASGALAGALNPVGGNFCTPQPPDPTSTATFSRRSRGVTLMGLPVLTGRVNTKGRYGQLDARIWDLDPQTDTQRLVTRGAYRLEDNERGRFRFVLDGNGWRFANGHRIVVELLGRDAPTYLPSPTRFSARLSRLKISLPIR